MVVRKIRWTRRALRRLDEIGAYISAQNPNAASKVLNRIVVAADSLASQPEMGRDGRIKGTRELVLPDISYVIAYRVAETSVDILTVVHTSRRWPTFL
ncbi:type II toxin-antitoxin system RelE/ParE family toxin [Rhizobium sp. C4]|uniref:type II toxin-antitoxin system RelE/ParE family toxin n=1 Tax=Rhizobium sp. C4 TaxID=1349800 RepID=UPI001E305CAB|nr:type II toxin-antitoxin system RelE/ParE family toxin [Rhizobium sp. C4]MCD2173305.1 type II toxin-antitoxin system RelE/ParE family toxin [Rhizobium sp. C4]